MKITQVQTKVLQKKVQNAKADSLHTYDVGGKLLTILRTDEGIEGYGITYFGRIPSGMATVKLIVDQVCAPLLIGRDPFFNGQIRQELYVATEYYGTLGVANFALAAVDQALWDIKGKACGMSVAQLLGACRDRIPAYAMVGWYYEGGEQEFVRQCIQAAEEGFRAVKLKVGRGSLEDGIARIRRIRWELGDSFRVMVDANCIFDEHEALRRRRAYEAEDVYWFEEPIQPYLRDAHVRLSRKLDVPLAIGENYFTRHQFHDLLQLECCGVLQPDNRRAGGITEWLDIAAMADGAGIPVASHGGGPANVNALCAIAARPPMRERIWAASFAPPTGEKTGDFPPVFIQFCVPPAGHKKRHRFVLPMALPRQMAGLYSVIWSRGGGPD